MRKLFIIGNGFDLAHDLNTKYSSFRKFLIEEYANNNYDVQIEVPTWENYGGLNIHDIYDGMDFIRLVIDQTEGNAEWKNFETTLGKLDFGTIFEFGSQYGNNEALRGFNSAVFSKINEAFDLLKKLFYEWIASLDCSRLVSHRWLKDNLDRNDLVINFNYTNVIEQVYGKKDVFHIHGFQGQPVIFGHGEKDLDEEELNLLYPGAEVQIEQLHYDLRKPVEKILKQEKTLEFLNQINKEVEQVITYGFSFGDVDIPYIKAIIDRLESSKVSWYLNEHDDKYTRDDFIEKIRQCGFKGDFKTYSDIP